MALYRPTPYGTDIDIPSSSLNRPRDITYLIPWLVTILHDPNATLSLEVIGKLEQKDAFRVRLKGMYNKEILE